MRLPINFISILVVAIMITSFTSCYYDKEELLYSGKSTTVSCGTISAKFAADANPIIKSKCATSGCHDAAGQAGGVVLVTYAQISALSARINQRSVVEKTMPSGGPLSVSEIAILKCWIDSGAPNN